MIRLFHLLIILNTLTYICSGQGSISLQPRSMVGERDEILAELINGEISMKEALIKTNKVHNDLENTNPIYKHEKHLYLGYIYYINNQEELSLKNLKNGLSKVQNKVDTIEFKYLSLIGDIYRNFSEIDSAKSYFSRGYRLLNTKVQISNQTPIEVASFLTNYGFLLRDNREYATLEIVLNKTIDICQKKGLYMQLGYSQNQLALLLNDKGHSTKAIEYFKKSIENAGNDFNIVPRTLHLVEALIDTGQWNEAAKYLYDAKGRLGQIKSSMEWHHVKLHTLEAKLAMHRKQRGKARYILTKTLYKYQQPSKYLAEAAILMADISDKQVAIAHYNRALQICSNTPEGEKPSFSQILFPVEYLEALQKRARLENPATAIRSLADAIQITTDLKKNYPFQESKFELNASIRPMVARVLDLSQGQENGTFLPWINKVQAASLNEALWDQKIKPHFQHDSLIMHEKALQQELNRAWLQQANSGRQDSSLSKKLNDLKIEMAFLKRQLEQENKAYYALKYKQNDIPLSEIKQILDPHCALICYFLTDSVAYASLITQNKAWNLTFRLPAKFASQIDELKNALYPNPGLGRYKGKKTAQEIYKAVFKPFEPYLDNIERLLIVRDSHLNLIPFEVLQNQEGQYLIDRFSIFYDYSAPTYFWAKSKQSGKALQSTLSIAPYANETFLLSKTRDRSLGRLPFSSLEVDQIGGMAYKNRSASKNRFFEEYQKHGVIHFATHAQMDDKEPGKSFIAFYPDNTNYKLYTEELYSLSLQNTELVVLSACEAGNGKLQKGEGLISLARGFAYAGCPSTITTLWKAHDESSAWLSSRLYHYLQKGWNKADALRQAKLDFRQSATGQEFKHPYYWANFILIGNDAPLQFPFWVKYKTALIILLVLSLVFIFWLFHKRRKRDLEPKP